MRLGVDGVQAASGVHIGVAVVSRCILVAYA